MLHLHPSARCGSQLDSSMAPTNNIILRIDSEEKEKIRHAATMLGESLTTFIRRTCLREAERELAKKEKQMDTGSDTTILTILPEPQAANSADSMGAEKCLSVIVIGQYCKIRA